MSENLPSKVLERLKVPFTHLFSLEDFGEAVNDIVELICLGQLNPQSLDAVLNGYRIKDIEKIKHKLLDLLLAYYHRVLDDNFITSEEAENVNLLKRLFRIKEGDFHKYKYAEIETILDRQLKHMYQNNTIDREEALQKVELQELFDLSYDQFLEISQKAVKAALNRGADPIELDTFIRTL